MGSRPITSARRHSHQRPVHMATWAHLMRCALSLAQHVWIMVSKPKPSAGLFYCIKALCREEG